MDDKLLDFAEKTVVFYVKTSPGLPSWLTEGIVLQSPFFEEEAGRTFIRGRKTLPQGEPYWSDGREAAIAWDTVFYYIVVPTDEYDAFETKEEEEKEPPTPVCPTPDPNKRLQGPGIKFSLILIGILIPAAILLAVIVWIVKMILG